MIKHSIGGSFKAAITKVEPHYAEYEIWIKPDLEQEEKPDITGSIKWDGCMNWQTNPDCMAHFCEKDDISSLSAAFLWVRLQAGQLMSNADKEAFR